MTFNKERMYEASEDGYTNATDLADYLVKKGVPFRESHGISGQIVNFAIKQNKKLWLYELGFIVVVAILTLIIKIA